MIDRNIANKAIATPIKGVVPQPGATFPYSKFKGFNKLPAPVHFGLGLELSSTVCVACIPGEIEVKQIGPYSVREESLIT
jgi:hypothetical protein